MCARSSRPANCQLPSANFWPCTPCTPLDALRAAFSSRAGPDRRSLPTPSHACTCTPVHLPRPAAQMAARPTLIPPLIRCTHSAVPLAVPLQAAPRPPPPPRSLHRSSERGASTARDPTAITTAPHCRYQIRSQVQVPRHEHEHGGAGLDRRRVTIRTSAARERPRPRAPHIHMTSAAPPGWPRPIHLTHPASAAFLVCAPASPGLPF